MMENKEFILDVVKVGKVFNKQSIIVEGFDPSLNQLKNKQIVIRAFDSSEPYIAKVSKVIKLSNQQAVVLKGFNSLLEKLTGQEITIKLYQTTLNDCKEWQRTPLHFIYKMDFSVTVSTTQRTINAFQYAFGDKVPMELFRLFTHQELKSIFKKNKKIGLEITRIFFAKFKEIGLKHLSINDEDLNPLIYKVLHARPLYLVEHQKRLTTAFFNKCGF